MRFTDAWLRVQSRRFRHLISTPCRGETAFFSLPPREVMQGSPGPAGNPQLTGGSGNSERFALHRHACADAFYRGVPSIRHDLAPVDA